MPTFQHQQASVTIGPGETWEIPAEGETYHDTAAETLRSIVAEMQHGRPWREVVAERFARINPWLYQIVTSPTRDLFFRQHPPAKKADILDIGAGWGQIALPLARAGHQVTALEPTPERLAFIQAAAAQDQVTDNLAFIQASFHQIQFTSRFDLICCIGVLEWTPKFQPGEPRAVQLQFLRSARAALQPGGRLVIGIENRLGLKYLLGAPDDHTGQRHISVLHAGLAASRHRAVTGGDLRAFTYTHAEYEQLFREAGFSGIETHGAFPDYKLPELILPLDPAARANQYLRENPIPPEHDGSNGSCLPNQEELVSHYRSLAQMGIAHCFCPSYFFVLQ